MLTYFEAIQLKHSVRAHGDQDFKRLQHFRTSPYELRENSGLKNDFFELGGRISTFVPGWNDSRINPNMMHVYSWVKPAQQALDEYRDSIKQQLNQESILYRVVSSRDSQC